MSRRFKSTRQAALAVLNSNIRLTNKGGCFLGQIVANNPSQLTRAQAVWLGTLLDQVGLPPLRDRGGR